jgi:hypothetical protein
MPTIEKEPTTIRNDRDMELAMARHKRQVEAESARLPQPKRPTSPLHEAQATALGLAPVEPATAPDTAPPVALSLPTPHRKQPGIYCLDTDTFRVDPRPGRTEAVFTLEFVSEDASPNRLMSRARRMALAALSGNEAAARYRNLSGQVANAEKAVALATNSIEELQAKRRRLEIEAPANLGAKLVAIGKQISSAETVISIKQDELRAMSNLADEAREAAMKSVEATFTEKVSEAYAEVEDCLTIMVANAFKAASEHLREAAELKTMISYPPNALAKSRSALLGLLEDIVAQPAPAEVPAPAAEATSPPAVPTTTVPAVPEVLAPTA